MTSETETKPLNLHQRLIRVMHTMGAVRKGGTTDYGEKFAYHKIDDIDDKLRGALIEHGVVATIIEIRDRKLDFIQDLDKYNKPRTTWYAECLIVLELVNADNPEDRKTIQGWGQGLDYSDKATGKAISYAAKSAYLSAFHLRGQPDNEAENIERPAEPVKKNHDPFEDPPPEKKPTPKSTEKPASKPEKKANQETAPKLYTDTVVKPTQKVDAEKNYDGASPEAQTWIDACRQCDCMESLERFVAGLIQQPLEIQEIVMPLVEKQKVPCWTTEINQCGNVAELSAVGKRIAEDKGPGLHAFLHDIYAKKLKALKQAGF